MRRTDQTSGILPTASLLFFLSGATGLAYEVIWFKRLSQVWGNSSLALAAVVASFLLGLGLGAHLLGKFADRVGVPLWWYGVSEAGIGVLAVVVPFEIAWLAGAAGATPSLVQHGLALSLVRCLLTFLVLGPVCFLMGGTLPLLVKQFTPEGSSASARAGWLYAVNTLGAAAGCYLMGFHILPALGLAWSNALTAGLNLVIGLTAIALARRVALAVQTESPASR